MRNKHKSKFVKYILSFILIILFFNINCIAKGEDINQDEYKILYHNLINSLPSEFFYNEEGFGGSIVIGPINYQHLASRFIINTINNSNGSQCYINGTCVYDRSKLIMRCHFEKSFGQYYAIDIKATNDGLIVINDNPPLEFCGMGVDISGKYTKK